MVQDSDSDDDLESSGGSTGGKPGSSGTGGTFGFDLGDDGGAPGEEGGAPGDEPVDCTKRGDITSSTTWSPVKGCPDGFEVRGSITVEGNGTELRIEPGVKLKFYDNAQLTIQTGASLIAVGTEEAPSSLRGGNRRRARGAAS